MGALADYIRPRLRDRFPERLTVHDGTAPFAEFAPVWEGFGTLALHDDDYEVAIYFGNFTHAHRAVYDDGLTQAEKLQATAELVFSDLELTFSDRLRFFGGRWGGGSCAVEEAIGLFERRVGTLRGTWSGPL